MPLLEVFAADPEKVAAIQDMIFEAQMVGRSCHLWEYPRRSIPSFDVETEFIAYSSPESTYAVTKRLFDGAKSSILVGIYDFTAGYVEELLLKAMRRGVKVALMLDLDNRTGETEVYDNLVKHGCEGVPAPSCASQNEAAYFASSHEKVIVIDGEWVLVQSGNYSENSIPQNETDGGDAEDFIPGNRDMGVAVRSKALASFFAKVLRRDMDLELRGAPEAAALRRKLRGDGLELFEAAPSSPPTELFPSKIFKPSKPIRVQPILSPDNYMEEIPKWLRAAKKSVYIEQQYIRGSQEKIGECMQAIADARTAHPDLDVRIIVARPFPGKSFDKEAKAIRDLRQFGVKLGENIRILNPKNFVHCHNKLIVVDDTTVLISSQNWSDAALVKNREAGLLLHYPEMARHYSKIFQSDWETARQTLTRKTKPELFGPESLATGKTVPINPGDYVVFGDDEDFRPPRKRPPDLSALSAERVRRRRRRPARPRARSARPGPNRRPRRRTGKR